VSARATGEIKSTWLGDVALIPGGGERRREGEEDGEKWKKRKEGGKRRGKNKEGKRRREVEEQEVAMPAFPPLQSHLLARVPCHLWSAFSCVLHARQAINMYFDGALEKKTPSRSKPSLISWTERMGDLAVFAAQEVWGSTWPSS